MKSWLVLVSLGLAIQLATLDLIGAQKGASRMRPRRPNQQRPKKGSHYDESTLWMAEPPATCGMRPVFPKKPNGTVVGGRGRQPDRPQIAGNRAAFYGEAPFYARVVVGRESATKKLDNNLDHYCGGALIGPDLVVTAAHCVEGAKEQVHQVMLGLNSPNQSAKVVMDAYQYCFYEEGCANPNELVDLAFLVLKDNVTYNNFIQPACFSPIVDPDPKGDSRSYFFVGMGLDDWGNTGERSGLVQLARFRRGCPDDTWQREYRWTNQTITCYRPTDWAQPCIQDFGGPLYYVGDELSGFDKRVMITGIASFGADENCNHRVKKPNYFHEINKIQPQIQGIQFNCHEPWQLEAANLTCFRPRLDEAEPERVKG